MQHKPKPGPYTSVAQIMVNNREAGQYFFEPDTLRFFNSVIYPDVVGGRYFVTSERMELTDPPKFSIRVALDNGHIEEVGEFQQWDSFGGAMEDLQAALEHGLEVRVDHGAGKKPNPKHYYWQVYLGDLPVYYKTSKAGAEELLAELAEA